MKKFLAIIAIASFAVACNGSGDKTETKDSTTIVAPVVVDTPAVVTPDTTVIKVDTTTKKDSTVK